MNKQYLFTNFGELYRAAFAEVNPATKQILLAEVKKALDHWQETAREEVPSTPKAEILFAPIRQAA